VRGDRLEKRVSIEGSVEVSRDLHDGEPTNEWQAVYLRSFLIVILLEVSV
jgi:hypothetical protein